MTSEIKWLADGKSVGKTNCQVPPTGFCCHRDERPGCLALWSLSNMPCIMLRKTSGFNRFQTIRPNSGYAGIKQFKKLCARTRTWSCLLHILYIYQLLVSLCHPFLRHKSLSGKPPSPSSLSVVRSRRTCSFTKMSWVSWARWQYRQDSTSEALSSLCMLGDFFICRGARTSAVNDGSNTFSFKHEN